MRTASSKRGPARNRTSPKQRSDQAARTGGNATDLLGDPATPGALIPLSLLDNVEQVGTARWTALCPAHDDDEPSLCIDVKANPFGVVSVYFSCKGCGANGDAVLAALGLGDKAQRIYHHRNEELLQRRPVTAAPLPSDDDLRRWSAALWADADRLGYLLEGRGLSAKVLRRFRLGWDDERSRYSLPVAGADGRLANVRFYRPDAAPGDGKMRGLRGRGGQVYPLCPEDAGLVLVTEGEWDCLVARSHGLTAVCGTLGAATWQPAWTAALAGRSVAFVYDCDRAGREGAAAAAVAVEPFAKTVRVVDLGLGSGEDVSDWFNVYGRSANELLRRIASTPSLGEGSGGHRG